ncbi:hypothetical protein [Streptacidiphilus carbonis]|jgi:hypothetical protein|uniref:hypothetical protein n=1 Tax=Streptacidiphilus carbonis TaxID=105422 RepID=UPI0005A765C2|nr:hypothetical protein [Streptacidiphilus carbonis]
MSVYTGGSVRRRRQSDRVRTSETRNPLIALAIALPVAALLAFAFGGWSQFTVQATSVLHLIQH